MRMEHIYTPWRMQYFDRDKKNPACAFCEALKSADSDGNLVVARGERDDSSVVDPGEGAGQVREPGR